MLNFLSQTFVELISKPLQSFWENVFLIFQTQIYKEQHLKTQYNSLYFHCVGCKQDYTV